MSSETRLFAASDLALDKFQLFRRRSGNPSAAIRITVAPEAPLPEKYQLEFEAPDSNRSGDVIHRLGGLVFHLDERSAELMAGTTIDFVEGMWSSGFRFETPDRLRLMSDPLATEVQRVLDEHVSPMLAAHGGQVGLVDVRDGRAYVQFGGGCQGCGLAPMTLKSGIVATLKRLVPRIVEVVDVTDHPAGESPYFAPPGNQDRTREAGPG